MPYFQLSVTRPAYKKLKGQARVASYLSIMLLQILTLCRVLPSPEIVASKLLLSALKIAFARYKNKPRVEKNTCNFSLRQCFKTAQTWYFGAAVSHLSEASRGSCLFTKEFNGQLGSLS